MLWWQYGLGKDLCIHRSSQEGVRGDLNFVAAISECVGAELLLRRNCSSYLSPVVFQSKFLFIAL